MQVDHLQPEPSGSGQNSSLPPTLIETQVPSSPEHGPEHPPTLTSFHGVTNRKSGQFSPTNLRSESCNQGIVWMMKTTNQLSFQRTKRGVGVAHKILIQKMKTRRRKKRKLIPPRDQAVWEMVRESMLAVVSRLKNQGAISGMDWVLFPMPRYPIYS
ncbi:hypothetical protein BDN72DRAFT_608627 [Pluteus cervinus]|uniref:Uncharacterized protein n=1 Tax=Pluteus cervinus TaxID=181527 RepID=A0ACD3A1E9_9AGAR|nr:hypothetical protein BDN72DRAFT_608627 [Pluteus cervinus]